MRNGLSCFSKPGTSSLPNALSGLSGKRRDTRVNEYQGLLDRIARTTGWRMFAFADFRCFDRRRYSLGHCKTSLAFNLRLIRQLASLFDNPELGTRGRNTDPGIQF